MKHYFVRHTHKDLGDGSESHYFFTANGDIDWTGTYEYMPPTDSGETPLHLVTRHLGIDFDGEEDGEMIEIEELTFAHIGPASPSPAEAYRFPEHAFDAGIFVLDIDPKRLSHDDVSAFDCMEYEDHRAASLVEHIYNPYRLRDTLNDEEREIPAALREVCEQVIKACEDQNAAYFRIRYYG